MYKMKSDKSDGGGSTVKDDTGGGIAEDCWSHLLYTCKGGSTLREDSMEVDDSLGGRSMYM